MASLCRSRENTADIIVQLRRVDVLLKDGAERLRQRTLDDQSEFRGLFISDREFQDLLNRPFGRSFLSTSELQAQAPLAPEAHSRWQHLIRSFRLSPFEADVLLLCLLPEIDLKYERVFAYLQDDVTCRQPSVALVLNLFCSDLPSRLRARRTFLPDAPLMCYRLLGSAHTDGKSSLLAQTLWIERRVVDFLLHTEGQVAWVPNYLTLERPDISLDDLALAPSMMAQISTLACAPSPSRLWIHLGDEEEWTALQCARALCTIWQMPLLRLDPLALGTKREEVRRQARTARRDSLLEGSALYLDFARDRSGNATPQEKRISGDWVGILDDHPYPVFWRTRSRYALIPEIRHRSHIVHLAFARPTYARRLALWRGALSAPCLADDVDLETLAGRYRLTGRQIERASDAARDAAWQQNPDKPVVGFHDLSMAARAISSGQLGQLARRVEPRHGWDDLILPDDRMAQLYELCDQFKYRHVVYDEWGFGRRASRGRGLSVLFAGPSGTGKTMAAEIIAKELALELYKIDLSGVVSKYIGETEKNMERIFNLARDSNAILLFDEADALFGKRSETKDAHDRYANIEVSYLLQKIEEYDGVVILTSNLRQNLDEAFLRRLQFTIEFPLPDEGARSRIWLRTLPSNAPLAKDVDLHELAKRYKFSGGSIRNVLVNAAFLAAREGNAIGMDHLLWAVRREFQKLGKLVDEGQFSVIPRA